MFSYLAFYNNTSYPCISVYHDDSCIVECLPKSILTRYHIFNSGSIAIAVCDSRLILLSDLYISLFPNNFYILNIGDNSSELK